MKDVKLTDFTIDELHTLLVAVLAAINHEECHPEQYLNLCLWRVQILNAISTVQMRNIPQQN